MAASIVVNTFRQEICKIQPFTLFRRQFTGPIIVFNKEPGQVGSAPQTISENVPGLSDAVYKFEEPAGPGASKSAEYKVPEYFCYNKLSYFEAEIEMSNYRCPQPSALKK